WRNDERAVQLINQPSNKDQIEATRHSADGSASRRAAVELSFSRCEGGQSHRPTPYVDDLSVQTVLLEDSGILGHKKHTAALVQSTVSHDDLCRRRSRADIIGGK